MFLQQKFFGFALFFLTACGGPLPGFSSDAPELATFFKLLQLESNSELYDQVKKGGVTVLAPTNAAFTAAGFTDPSAVEANKLNALLRYHILHGVHASASFQGSATFFATLLNKDCCSAYTNESSGVVVEAKEIDGEATVLSALWAQSKITTAYSFDSGLVHEIDRVLEIPLQYAQTVTSANLTYLVALSEHTHLFDTKNAPAVLDIQYSPEVTIFAPNSPQYATEFTGWDDLTLAQDLKLWHYHLVNGSALYSPNLSNGAQFTTAAGLPVTVSTENGEIYINDAKVIQRDLLQANGVIQVIDRPLNPNHTDARPAFARESSGSVGLSSVAKVGVAVGVVVAVVLIAAAVAYWLLVVRRRKRGLGEIGGRGKVQLGSSEAVLNRGGNGVHDTYAGKMATKANTWELESRSKKSEL